MQPVIMIIDMQPQYAASIPAGRLERMVKSQMEVIRSLAVPVLPIEFKDSDKTLPWLKSAAGGRLERTIVKDARSAMSNKATTERLEYLGADNVIIMGIYASQCVLETARDLRPIPVCTAHHLIADPSDREYRESVAWYRRHARFFESHLDLIDEMKSPNLTSGARFSGPGQPYR